MWGCLTFFLIVSFLGVVRDGFGEFLYLAMKHPLIVKLVTAGIVFLLILSKAGAIVQRSGQELTPGDILKRFRPADVLWIPIYTIGILLIIAVIWAFCLGLRN